MSKFMSKVLALTLTLALALSMSTVAFANDTPPIDQELTGDGDVTYINTEIYQVSLPTGKAFNFKLDPQGLLDVGATGTNLDDLEGGKIIGGDPVKFINKSSVPVKVTAAIQAVGSDAVYATAGTTVESGTAENVLLYMAPSKANIKTQASTAYAATEKGFVLTEAAQNLDFLLPAAAYKVVADSTTTPGTTSYALTMVNDEGNGNALQLGGAINSKADWSDYVGSSASKSIGVKAVFKFEKDLTEYATSAYDASTAYGLLNAEATFPVAERAVVGATSGGVKLLSGATGDTQLTALPSVGSSVSFRISGLTGKQVSDFKSLKIGGVDLLTPQHYTVALEGGLLKVTFTTGTGWFTLRDASNTIVAKVGDDTHTFNVTLG